MEAMNQFYAATVEDGVSVTGAKALPGDAAPHPLQCSGPDFRIEPDSHGSLQRLRVDQPWKTGSPNPLCGGRGIYDVA